MALLVSAFVLGLMGSFHCAGMCGPIALSLPLPGDTIWQKIQGGVFYNTGRILTYGIMGVIFGLVGQGLHLIGFQQIIAVIMGVIMVIAALFPALFKTAVKPSGISFGLLSRLKKAMGRLLPVRSYPGVFSLGMLNGLLPCGLVYFAIAGAIAAGGILAGTWYMIFFGLGTIPMLLAISITGNIISNSARQKINKVIPILIVAVGIFFILRGLNLGIPYLSPTKEKIEKRFEKGLQENPLPKLSDLKSPTPQPGTSTFPSRSCPGSLTFPSRSCQGTSTFLSRSCQGTSTFLSRSCLTFPDRSSRT